MDINEIRRRNLLALLDREAANGGQRGARARFASAIERAPDLITRWSANKPLGSDVARHIEACLHLPSGWMDQRHDAQATKQPPGGAVDNSTDRLRLEITQHISSAPATTVAEIARLLHLPLPDATYGSQAVKKLTADSDE